ncbi:hypothetical protein CJ030_MR5G025019 [Morella rubra]|uniref:Uncharacterized protein n=1 Tax=Morella rubra TaxID=262757 RepID=A0A6A1VHL7_9ROSI|nr:hypothetical protein CJ030_MR5G025019 [Morella rubra]
MRFYIELVKEKKALLRHCYSEKIQFSDEEFSKIILVDAAFIIKVLLTFYFREENDNDHIFIKPWMIYDVWLEMILLEDQLMFFILEDLYDPDIIMVQSSKHDERPSIIHLSHHYLKHGKYSLKGTKDHNLEVIRHSRIEHFVDLLRYLYIPSEKADARPLETVKAPSMIELQQTGIKFKVGSSKNLFDIQFNNGNLDIPRVNVGPILVLAIRNIITFEKHHYRADRYMNDYVVLMSRLVMTLEDLDLMVTYGLIEKRSRISATHIQNFSREAIFYPTRFYFAHLCEDLNAYCEAPWHKWKVTLKQNYFDTPWAIISFIAAVILLLLTLIQAVSSVISIT